MQVVLCTCTAAADPQIAALPPFDLALLDEAGQATQPNGLLPLLRAPRAVLVGDPMQLPPIVIGAEAAAEAHATMHHAPCTTHMHMHHAHAHAPRTHAHTRTHALQGLLMELVLTQPQP